jgi:translation initiation factor 4A
MTESTKVYETFDEMGLKEELLRGIFGYGFEKPSVIQSEAIKPMTTGEDLIAQASSGTGKTGAFTIGLLQQLDYTDKPYCQAIILSPTKELAEQTNTVVNSIGGIIGVKTHICIGGKAVKNDLDILKMGIHVMIGTPGRVMDLLGRNAVDISKIKIIIVDEADSLLERGFKEQIYLILKSLPDKLQVCLFSATLSDETLEITSKFMINPIQILVKKENVKVVGIQQYYVEIPNEEGKIDVLMDLYEKLAINQCIIYCNSRPKVGWLYGQLKEQLFPVGEITGEMPIEAREMIMEKFRNGLIKILITTDLLARGIDVQAVSIVINYDVPTNRENYMHRIGRCGRYGRKGKAVNFITPNDGKYIKDIQAYYSVEMIPLSNPDILGTN